MGVDMRSLVLLFGAVSLLACGGGKDSDEEADAVTKQCAEICEYWASCNNRELNDGECLSHCRNLVDDVSDSCFDLYAAMTDCQVSNLNCADPLGTACESEREAYLSCGSD